MKLRPVRIVTPSPSPVLVEWSAHSKAVNALALVGDRILTAGEDSVVAIWSLEGERLGTLDGISKPINALAWDGDHLVTGGDDHAVCLLELPNFEIANRFEGHTAYVRDVAISGQTAVSVSEDKTMRIWNLQTGECLVCEPHKEMPAAVTIWGDVAVSTDRTNNLLRWDLHTGAALEPIYEVSSLVAWAGNTFMEMPNATGVGHRKSPNQLHAHGDSLYSGGMALIRWDRETREEVARKDHPWPIETIAINPLGCFTGAFSLWWLDPITLEKRKMLPGPKGGIRSMAIDAERQIAVLGGAKGDVRVLKLDLDAAVDPHADGIRTFALGARYAATGDGDNTVALWDLETGLPTVSIEHFQESGSRELAFCKPDRVVIMRRDAEHGLGLCDTETGDLLRTITLKQDSGQPRGPHSIAVLSGGNRALVGHLGEGFIEYDLVGDNHRVLDGWTSQVRAIALALDETHAVTTAYCGERKRKDFSERLESRHRIQGWDLRSGDLIWTVTATPRNYLSYSIVIGERLVHPGHDDTEMVIVRDIRTGAELWRTGAETYEGMALDDSRALLLLDEDEILVLDIHAEQAPEELDIRKLRDRASGLVAGGGHVAYRSSEGVSLLDRETLEEVAHWEKEGVQSVAFHRDDTRLIATDSDGLLHVLLLERDTL